MRWIAAAVLALATLAGAACGADDTSTTGTTGTTESTNEVSQGAGSQDASKDVVLDTVIPGDFGFATPQIIVTNNSSKRSDYYIEANVEDQSSGAVVGYTNALVSNLDPGKTAAVSMVDVEWKSTYTLVFTEIQRTASA